MTKTEEIIRDIHLLTRGKLDKEEQVRVLREISTNDEWIDFLTLELLYMDFFARKNSHTNGECHTQKPRDAHGHC